MTRLHPPKPMPPADFHALMSDFHSGQAGEDDVFVSNTSPFMHLHTLRIGKPASPLARIVLAAHEMEDEVDTETTVEVILTPAEARVLAATLCNLADEADGTDPISADFFIREPGDGE